MKTLLFSVCFFTVINLSATGPTEDMFEATKTGDYAKFKTALAAGADIKAFNQYGNTPLLDGIIYPDMVRDLIAAKADLNQPNKAGNNTPLSICALFGLVESMKLLIEAGADINWIDPATGNNLLMQSFFAAMPKEGIELLIKKGVSSKHVNKAGYDLLQSFAIAHDPNYRVEYMKTIQGYRDKMGYKADPVFANSTPSQWSTIEERLELIKSLGYDLSKEYPEVVGPLVPKADEVNKQLRKSNITTNLMFLAANTNMSSRAYIIKGMVQKGEDIKTKYGPGGLSLNRNIAHVCALRVNTVKPDDDVMLVDALVSGGVDIGGQDNLGFTPLMYAAKFGNLPMAKALLKQAGCNINAYSKEKRIEQSYNVYSMYGWSHVTEYKITYRTALNWAVDAGNTEIANLIKQAGGKGTKELDIK
jgi:ankyrin repeat protein